MRELWCREVWCVRDDSRLVVTGTTIGSKPAHLREILLFPGPSLSSGCRREIAMLFEELYLGRVPNLIRYDAAQSSQFGPQCLIADEEVIPSKDIQIRIRHDLLEQTRSRLRDARRQDDVGDGKNLCLTVAEVGEDLGCDLYAGFLVPLGLSNEPNVVEVCRRHNEDLCSLR